MLEELIVALIVLVAAVTVLRRLLPRRPARTSAKPTEDISCEGGCAGCPVAGGCPLATMEPEGADLLLPTHRAGPSPRDGAEGGE